jgi:hypothetical protein
MPMPMIDVSEEMKQRAIDLAAEGKYLRDILPQLGLKPSQFLKYRVRNPSFEREFNQARDMGRELIAENLGRLVDDDPFGDPQLLRLKSDNGWKLLAVQDPNRYAMRNTVTIESVDLGSALTEARSRANRVIDVTPAMQLIEGPDPFE